jgi:Rieske Fe-S protein
MHSPEPTTPIKRRPFLKALLYLSSLPVLGVVQAMLRRADSAPESAETTLILPYVPTPGIRFYDRVIVTNSEHGLAVFSAACPHLGCRIDRTDGGELVCPCHGSRFDESGAVVHSPATRGLQPLEFHYDPTGAVLRIVLRKA